MSLLRAVLRATAVAALRNRTFAGSQVYNSTLAPFVDALQGQQAAPYIVVYTDADDWVPMRGVAEVYDAEQRSLTLVIEIGIAGAVKDQKGSTVIRLAPTDEAMELSCDLMGHQVMAALIGDQSSEWADLFKKMIDKVRRMPTRRGGQAQSGVRFAARRITMIIEPSVYDFAPGHQPAIGHPVWTFVRLAQDPANVALNLAETADVINKMLTPPRVVELPDWQQMAGLLGIDAEATKMLNVDHTPLPYPGTEADPLDWSDAVQNPAELEVITLEEGGDTFNIDNSG